MKKFLSLYLRTVKIAWRKKWHYIAGVTFGILLVAFSNYAVFKIKDIVNAIESGGDIVRPLVEMAIILIVPIIVQPISYFYKSYVYSIVTGDIINSLYKKVMSLDYAYHTNKETGRVVSLIMNSHEVPMLFLWNLEIFAFEQIASIAIPLILLGTISPELALYTGLFILVLLPLYGKLVKFGVKERNKLKEVEYKRNSAIIDGVTNYETVRIFARKKDEMHYLSGLVDENVKAIDRYQTSFRILDFASHIGGLAIFGIGAGFIYINRLTLSIGEIVVIVTYMLQLSRKILDVVFSSRTILKNLPLVEDIYSLMDRKSTINEPKRPKKIEKPRGKVKFDHVTFSYNKGKGNGVLHDVSFNINAGETVAFVGPSGGGKSTIARLILRYFDVNKGKVLIDGVNVKALGTENVNSIIGVVPQEPVLFNRSLKYNIGYGFSADEDELDKYMDQIVDAAKKAQIYDFILSLPDGFDTVVGERGLKLSGGQKQRVAIARVIIKNPKIIIFDEATSMLDSESEEAIQKAFHELSRHATTVVIAHRLSTIKNADRIFVVDGGNIVESGNHKQLVQNGNLYAKLWRMQSEGFIKTDN
ncbi:MAG TPA: ABC transporter ATP-binding protein [Candidatus Dojkabacteria bacterium]|nr:ABC transporter ATP-binding protein [Candidatus Dojkabacteria bacterium]